MPKENYLKYSINIEEGAEVNLKSIAESLIECGYERVEVVEGKGEFSFRGGILDVFPPIAIYPYRVELFGDEVDSIRTFNIEFSKAGRAFYQLDIENKNKLNDKPNPDKIKEIQKKYK